MSMGDYLSDGSDWLDLDCDGNCSNCEYKDECEECEEDD